MTLTFAEQPRDAKRHVQMLLHVRSTDLPLDAPAQLGLTQTSRRTQHSKDQLLTLMYDQNGLENHPKSIAYLWPKWLKTIPFGAAHTYLAHKKGVTPGPSILSCFRVVEISTKIINDRGLEWPWETRARTRSVMRSNRSGSQTKNKCQWKDSSIASIRPKLNSLWNLC